MENNSNQEQREEITITLTESELERKLLVAGMTKIKEIQNDLSMMGLMLAKGHNGRWQARAFND